MFFAFWVTRDCNLRCDYCYLDKKKQYMTEDIAKKAVEFSLDKIYKNKKVNSINKVLLHGGEPTLNFNIIKTIVNEYKSKVSEDVNLEFDMTTNGTITSTDIINFIADNKISLSVSMDGKEEEHNRHRKFISGKGSFDIVINNLLKYKEAGIDVRIRMTVTSENIDKIFENYKYFYELGFKSISFALDLYNTNWTKRDVELYEENQKAIIEFLKGKEEQECIVYLTNLTNSIHKVNMLCGGGTSSFNINSNGDLYPCSFSMDHNEFRIGNIYDGIDNHKLSEICEINRTKNECCEGCGFYTICSGGKCKILNKTITGDYYKPNAINCHVNNSIRKIENEYKEKIEGYKNMSEISRKFLAENRGVRMI